MWARVCACVCVCQPATDSIGTSYGPLHIRYRVFVCGTKKKPTSYAQSLIDLAAVSRG